MDDFTRQYKNISDLQKLKFLEELLKKDRDLQQQFLQFTQGQSYDDIVGVDINKLRDEIWDKLISIDTEDLIGECHYHYYEDEGMGEEVLENIFFPYRDSALEYIAKGNYIDAFRTILAIYEIYVEEDTPEIEDDYYIFGDDIESYIEAVVSSCVASFNDALAMKVLATDLSRDLIELYFQRHLIGTNYHIDHFDAFFALLISNQEMAQYLLDEIEEFKLNCIKSARTMLYCAKVIEDDALYFQIANEFYQEDSDIALALLNKYKMLGNESQFATIAKSLLDKESSRLYTLTIIENINKENYQEIYIKALRLYIQDRQSITHYQLLREYLEIDERLKFIEIFNKFYSPVFYIQLLALEEQYEKILKFAQQHNDSYNIAQILQPIITIYPNESFEIIKGNVTALVHERGRGNYARAAEILTLMKPITSKTQELKALIKEFYNHQPRLPALRDEFEKAQLL